MAVQLLENSQYILLRQRSKHLARQLVPKDPWLAITMFTAYAASITSFWYFFQTHQLVLYGDTYAHMLITRRIFDNATPGLAQLGGVWLPLPHLLMLPFIWNNYLWRTGLAGSIPSMACYMLATVYLFLAARRLTKDSRASFVGTSLFILNPNVLYLQTTALSEIVLIATLTAASYYFLAWAQEDKLNALILAAVATFLATMARYDGWFLFLAFLVLIMLIGVIKRQRRAQIEGNLIVFGIMGGLGIFLWLAWCYIIFGDPLYFQRGPFSSQAQQKALIDAHVLFTYHDLWQSIRYYTLDCILNVGAALFVLGLIAIVVFVFRRRQWAEVAAALVFLVPFVFYVLSLYTGQAALYVPGAVPSDFEHQIYNARYGVELVAPMALFLATLASSMSMGRKLLRFLLSLATSEGYPRRGTLPGGQVIVDFKSLGHIVIGGVIIVQTVLTASGGTWNALRDVSATPPLSLMQGGIVSLQDGQFGLSCAHSHSIIIFLAQHYGGGRILEDLYDTKIDALNPEAGIDFKNVVYEGSGRLWQQSLRNPASMVNWIIVNPADQHDLVAQRLTPAFNAQFTRDIEEANGLSLFHRNGLSFPTRPVPTFLLTEHTLCTA